MMEMLAHFVRQFMPIPLLDSLVWSPHSQVYMSPHLLFCAYESDEIEGPSPIEETYPLQEELTYALEGTIMYPLAPTITYLLC